MNLCLLFGLVLTTSIANTTVMSDTVLLIVDGAIVLVTSLADRPF